MFVVASFQRERFSSQALRTLSDPVVTIAMVLTSEPRRMKMEFEQGRENTFMFNGRTALEASTDG